MSGIIEIKRWVSEYYDISKFDNAEEAYQTLNSNEDWRNDLDDILLDQKPEFLDWLDSQIPTKEVIQEVTFKQISVKAYSYINRFGTTVNVKSHTRRIQL